MLDTKRLGSGFKRTGYCLEWLYRKLVGIGVANDDFSKGRHDLDKRYNSP